MVTPLRLRHDGLRDLDGNPNFLHINEEQKALIISTAEIVSGHTEDISDLFVDKLDKPSIFIEDNFVSFNIDGQVKDSGYKFSDIVEETPITPLIADRAIADNHGTPFDTLFEEKADKETTYTKSEVEQIKLELLDLIYAGL